MTDITFILDLTRSIAGAQETIAAWRALNPQDCDLMVASAEVEGHRLASTLVQHEPSVTSRDVGSGTGGCDWHRAVLQAHGTHIVFLRPGDRPGSDIVGTSRTVLTRHSKARWLIGTRPGASTDAWWLQPDLSDSVAALLIAGVSFAECTAVVQRTAWLDVADTLPETRADASRASAWVALAFLHTPVVIADVVGSAVAESPSADADMLAVLLEACARRDPRAAARLMVDVSRIARGMRVGYDLMNEAMDVTSRCLGRTPAVRADPRDWLERWQFFEGIVGRGARELWIWGAGQRGLDALRWLRQHRVTVTRFLDSDSARDGSEWGGLPVQHVKPAITPVDRASPRPLIVIASMYHADMTSELITRGFRHGSDFVVFHPDVSWASPGDSAR
jgi:hypothetical protein